MPHNTPKPCECVIPLAALSLFLFSVAPGCSDIWKPLAQRNIDNCVANPDACHADEVCNVLTEQCEPRRSGDMSSATGADLASPPDLATSIPYNTYAALFQSGTADQAANVTGWNIHATTAAVDVGSALDPTGWSSGLSSGVGTTLAVSTSDVGYTYSGTDRGYLSVADTQHIAPQVLLIWTISTASTDTLATPQNAWLRTVGAPTLSTLSLTKQNLLSVGFRVRTGNPDNAVYAALRVAGTWYLSSTSGAKFGGNGFNDADAKVSVSTADPIWEAMPGIRPELGQLTAAPPKNPSALPDGKIDAWGVIAFTAGRKDENSRIAIDNYVIRVAK